MKTLAIICNLFLFLFLCFVILTDGFSREASHITSTIWYFLTIVFSVVVIWKIRLINSSVNRTVKIVAIISNIIFLGFACWAFINEYPHPKEDGFITFVVIMFLTPILNMVVLIRYGKTSL